MSNELISDQGKLVRAELDMQITTAKAYPRNPDDFIQLATQLATQDEETAQSCFYCLSRKSRDGKVTEIKGGSIRLAEIAAASWGNLHAASRIVEIEYNSYLYKERNFIERFFNRIKNFRRIATRYDKTAAMFMGALILTGILTWLKL